MERSSGAVEGILHSERVPRWKRKKDPRSLDYWRRHGKSVIKEGKNRRKRVY